MCLTEFFVIYTCTTYAYEVHVFDKNAYKPKCLHTINTLFEIQTDIVAHQC